jgi:glycosyltransferase involved in cell wall biosynthesis
MSETERVVEAYKMANSVTVVICVYTRERWATLQLALEAARRQIEYHDELILVVDHNDALLSQYRNALNGFRILSNNRMRGLSGARNTALDAAHGSIIVFLDDDAIPLDGWLDALRAPYSDKDVYGVGGVAKPQWIGTQPRWFPEEFLWVVGCSHRGLPPNLQPIRNLVGANMSFRKTAFDRVGGFTEYLGRVGDKLLGCEETEFSIRLTQASPGAIILYEPSSQVEHHVAQQRESLRYFIRRCWSEGLSKAEVSRRVGRTSALSSERYYVLRVLPGGIWKGFHDAVDGDIWGATRSLAIVLGFVTTTAGYLFGTFCPPSDNNR